MTATRKLMFDGEFIDLPESAPVASFDDRLKHVHDQLTSLDACLVWLRKLPVCPEPQLTTGTDREAQCAVEARKEVENV